MATSPRLEKASIDAKESDRARFWAKVDRNGPVPKDRPEFGPCWVWTASCFRGGYGSFNLGGRMRRAPILAYEWSIGPTNGRQVHHLCNVPPCVNPGHLELGTPKQNIRYAASFGRMTHGNGPGLWVGSRRGVRGDNPWQQFRPSPSLESDQARFWAMVAIPDDLDDCFRWTGGLFPTGYGGFWTDGKMRRAHVVAYRWFVGEIPAKLVVCHTCPGGGNRWCVNPRHLGIGTRKQNMEQAVEAGRIATGDRNGMRIRPDRHWSRSGSTFRPSGRPGEKHPLARLTDDDVREIRRLAAAGMMQKDIAQQYNVSSASVSLIITRKTWTHLPGPAVAGRDRKPRVALTEQDVLEIRRLAASGTPQQDIAHQYGTSCTNISMIVRRQTWTHLPQA